MSVVLVMSVSDNAGTTSADDGLTAKTPVVSELLCFVTDKCNVLPVDDLVKVCCSFYTESEMVHARNIIDSTGVHLPRRKGAGKLQCTMEDIVKPVSYTHLTLPTIYSV